MMTILYTGTPRNAYKGLLGGAIELRQDLMACLQEMLGNYTK